ncbi:hypothetical protein, partial [Streptococcus pneumoniae]|uniref:hypothetical protein n=1 Tax=Streptococcus pneumoniae TaxID=1313 RepID=UPI001E6092FD
CRTGWGRYLALDLENARVLNEKDADTEAFYLWLRATDEAWALEILRKTCDHQQELEYHLRAKDFDETEIPEHLQTLWDE